jgi:hypothetical protein
MPDTLKITAIVRRSSRDRRIPPLSDMKGDGIIIIRMNYSGMSFSLRVKLYELLSPIKQYSDTKINNCIFPIQGCLNKNRQDHSPNEQRKEVPPNELRCLLGFIPDILNSIHGFSPLRPFFLSPLSSRKLIRNNIFFNRSERLCP